MHASTAGFRKSPALWALLILFWVWAPQVTRLHAASTAPSSSAVTADSLRRETVYAHGEIQNRLMVESGYRRDELEWSIAGTLFNNLTREDVPVNILSELTWKDLDIFQVRLSNETLVAGRFFFRFACLDGTIYDGDNQDSDYKGNNRTEEWSRSNNSADEGEVHEISVATGYRFDLWKRRIALTPLLGYAYHEQNLVMTDGFQTVSEPDPALNLNPPEVGPFDGLNSTYEARWRGPWLGLDAAYALALRRPAVAMRFGVGLEYHWVIYSGSADWNLRSDLAHPESFEHEAAGTGVVLAARWRCEFAGRLGLNLSLNYQEWSTEAGTDRVYRPNRQVVETRLNEVNWASRGFLVGVDYTF